MATARGFLTKKVRADRQTAVVGLVCISVRKLKTVRDEALQLECKLCDQWLDWTRCLLGGVPDLAVLTNATTHKALISC